MSSVDAGKSGSRSLPQRMLLSLLRGYQRLLSPMFLPSCRYVPTCSDYAAEAIEKQGALLGSALAAWRLLRCHPFVRGGFDPVPNISDGQGFFRTRASAGTQVEPATAGSVCSHTTH
jgi:hypothetical protein